MSPHIAEAVPLTVKVDMIFLGLEEEKGRRGRTVSKR